MSKIESFKKNEKYINWFLNTSRLEQNSICGIETFLEYELIVKINSIYLNRVVIMLIK